MTTIDHEHWAREILKYLVAHVKRFHGGSKYIHYGELAKAINYPPPYLGSAFASNIGHTLGNMGHLIENVVIDGERPPYIQALVVAVGSNLPGDGIKEFYSDYPNLPNAKKRDLIFAEYQRIFEFGSRWETLLSELSIKADEIEIKKNNHSLHNPYGSEGSPEHRALRDYVFEHPEIFEVKPDDKFREYPLKSGDSIDVMFEMSDEIIGVEVKSIRSGDDDLERGIYQCIKYRAVLESENLVSGVTKTVKCFLVLEGSLSRKLSRISEKLGVKVLESFQHKNA